MQFTPLILVLSAFVAVNTSPVPSNNGLEVARDISSNIAYDLERRQKKAGASKAPAAAGAVSSHLYMVLNHWTNKRLGPSSKIISNFPCIYPILSAFSEEYTLGNILNTSSVISRGIGGTPCSCKTVQPVYLGFYASIWLECYPQWVLAQFRRSAILCLEWWSQISAKYHQVSRTPIGIEFQNTLSRRHNWHNSL